MDKRSTRNVELSVIAQQVREDYQESVAEARAIIMELSDSLRRETIRENTGGTKRDTSVVVISPPP